VANILYIFSNVFLLVLVVCAVSSLVVLEDNVAADERTSAGSVLLSRLSGVVV